MLRILLSEHTNYVIVFFPHQYLLRHPHEHMSKIRARFRINCRNSTAIKPQPSIQHYLQRSQHRGVQFAHQWTALHIRQHAGQLHFRCRITAGRLSQQRQQQLHGERRHNHVRRLATGQHGSDQFVVELRVARIVVRHEIVHVLGRGRRGRHSGHVRRNICRRRRRCRFQCRRAAEWRQTKDNGYLWRE